MERPLQCIQLSSGQSLFSSPAPVPDAWAWPVLGRKDNPGVANTTDEQGPHVVPHGTALGTALHRDQQQRCTCRAACGRPGQGVKRIQLCALRT